MAKDSSAKYCQNNKESLQKTYSKQKKNSWRSDFKSTSRSTILVIIFWHFLII